MSQDHHADRAAQLARARAIARDPQDYQRRLEYLVWVLTGKLDSAVRAVLMAEWAGGVEDAARRAERGQ